MILRRAHVLLKDDRKDLRIGEKGRLSWQIKYKQREGLARIRNISASGMLMETDVVFDPKEECIFSFDTRLGADNYIPQIGRMVWHHRKKFSRRKYLCGIKFLEADEQVLARMRSRVQEGVRRFLKKRRVTTAVGFLLCAAFMGLIGYVVWFSGVIYRDITAANRQMLSGAGGQAALAQNYARLYRASEAKLTETTERLDIANQLIQQNKAALVLFSKELEATRALLNETEMMLTQANERNAGLNGELEALRAQVEEQAAQEEEDDAAPLAGPTPSIADYRLQLKSIKNEIKRLQDEERAARVAAITQMDDEKLRIGNNGYIVKDGQVVWVDEERYRRLTADEHPSPVAAQADDRAIEIDVTFFE